jgi:hypothetical protein
MRKAVNFSRHRDRELPERAQLTLVKLALNVAIHKFFSGEYVKQLLQKIK